MYKRQSTTSTAPAAAPTDRPAARSGNSAGLGPLTAERLQASEVWLRKTPGHHYFIQLLNIEASAAHEVEAFLATHSNGLDSQQLRVYRSSLSGQDRIGVIYGDFATRNEAIEAIGTLPAALRMTQPHPRAVARLR